MSAKHPVVAITGSSGAGTSTVTRSFQHIFRREHINAVTIEGDSFHGFDREAMKKAVEEAARSGVVTYCMSLDPRADQYVSRIFGARNYMIVDHVERLPERLPLLYAGLTR